MESEWPPLKECPQYRCGMLPQYLQKFDWEEEDVDDTIEFEYDDDDEKFCVTYKRRTLKEFLKQVRTTRGYDVNLRFMQSPFWYMNLYQQTRFDVMLRKSIEVAINYINLKTGKVYKHVKTLKAIDSPNRLYLLTFTAKIADSGEQAADSGEQAPDSGEQAADSGEQTFLATVFAPMESAPIEEYKVYECLLKPEGPAPWTYEDFRAGCD